VAGGPRDAGYGERSEAKGDGAAAALQFPLAQAHATRLTRQVGYRDRVFDLLQRAKALDIPGKNLTDLRCEAAACLGDFVGLAPTTLISFPTNSAPADRTQVLTLSCLDGVGHLAAFALVDGTILLCDIHSGKQVARLSSAAKSIVSLCFNDSGDHLFAVCGPTSDNWPDFAPKRRVCTWVRDANGLWNKTENRPLPGANGLTGLGGQVVVLVVDIDFSKPLDNTVSREARFRLFSLTSGGFLAGFDATNSCPGWFSFYTAAIPDQRLLAVETVDMQHPTSSVVLNLYNWQTGRLIKQLPLTGSGLLNYSDDGKFLAWLSPAVCTIYSLPDLEIVHQFREDFQDGALFFGTMVALPIWQQCRIRLWDLVTREDVAILDEPEVSAPVDCSSDGSYLLTVGQRQARLYHLKTPEKLELPPHAGVVPGAAFSADGSRLASIGRDKALRVCDTLTGRILWQVTDLPGSRQCVRYSPDGNWLATGDYDNDFVRIWDAQSGKRLLDLGTNSAAGLTFSVEFSPDGHWLAAAGQKGVRLWAMKSGQRNPGGRQPSAELVKSFAEPAMSLTFAPDSGSLAFFSPSNLYMWPLDKSERPHVVTLGAAGAVHSATPMYLWHFDWLNQHHPVASGIVSSVQSAAFTPDGRGILTLNPTGEVATLDVSSGKPVSSFRVGPQTRPRNLALSRDGSKLALTSVSGLGVELWNPKTGTLLYSLPEQSGTVCWLAWSPDSRRLAVARGDGNTAIWDLESVGQILDQAGLND
jgi:WD40 repeat protein